MDYSKFISKKEKWLKLALVLAVVIIIFGALIFTEFNKKEEPETIEIIDSEKSNNLWYIKYIIIGNVIILCFLFKGGKAQPTLKPDEEIIKFVADEIYMNKGIYLDTNNSNVRVQRGAPEETYVEFLKEHIIYLCLEGVGIIERYPGESIKSVKEGKQDDKIQVKLAEIGIARKKHLETLEEYGLTEETS